MVNEIDRPALAAERLVQCRVEGRKSQHRPPHVKLEMHDMYSKANGGTTCIPRRTMAQKNRHVFRASRVLNGGAGERYNVKMARSRLLLGLSVLLAGCAVLAEDTGDEETSIRVIERTDACFFVQVPGETAQHTVHGELVTKGSFSRAVLLLHGAAGSRDVWTGLPKRPWWHVASAPDASAFLAAHGYGVFVVDRLGYGESTYGGPGFALSIDAHIEMTHQIVQQIRAGTYGCSNGQAASSVFLGGQSLGALIVEGYATRYDDVDGVISSGTSVAGLGLTFQSLIETHLLPQVFAGNDYVTLFPYGPDGVSQQCVDGVFYEPGSAVANIVCSEDAPGTIVNGLTPSGDFLSAEAATEEVFLNTGNVEIPILFVLADQDAFVPGAGGGPSGQEPDMQAFHVNHWQNSCNNCEVSVTSWGTRTAGHMWQFHFTGWTLLHQMASWLNSH
jgi:pimeloyl-ACP methyl ester carboxylesterase